jgi:hypothetical protein
MLQRAALQIRRWFGSQQQITLVHPSARSCHVAGLLICSNKSQDYYLLLLPSLFYRSDEI